MKNSRVRTWEDLEDEIQRVLVDAQRRHPVAWHRFYDTRSAGAATLSQPSDFMVGHNGQVLFLEAKFSEVAESLRSVFSGSVTDNQVASARIWERAGIGYRVLFYSALSGRVEVWKGPHIIAARRSGSPLQLQSRVLYDSVSLALAGEVGYA